MALPAVRRGRADKCSMSTPEPAAVRLVNATGEPVFVLVAGKPVRLEQTDVPVLLQFHPHKHGYPWPVTVVDGGPVAEMDFLPDAQEIGILSCPPRRDGVVYLVAPDILLQFPDRDDFVTAALFQSVKPRKDGKVAKPGRRRWVLIGVTRQAWATTGPDTVTLGDGDKPALLVEVARAAGGHVPKPRTER